MSANGTYVPSQADVVVIGGGPAGSTASTLIAQRGHSVVLLERDHHPRFHIGESLIPETYWVLKRLNMLDKMKGSAFVKKLSVQFVSENGKLSAPFYFWNNKPHECSSTWQVLRSEFDYIMLQNAREHGVQAFEGCHVLDVLFDGGKAVGVRVKTEDGGEHVIRSTVVVDASGQSSIIANRLKLRVMDPVLKKAALWTYWEGAHRAPGDDGGATLVIQNKGKKGWWWYIPLHRNVTSVGLVGAMDYLFKGRGDDREKIYAEEVERCIGIQERIKGAKRVAGFFATKDYSYRASKPAGDGWVLAGDAFGFLDPLYSSGVLLALKSGEMAADAVHEGLAKGDVSGEQLGKWGPGFVRGMDRMRRLVCEFYDGFSFGKFSKKHPHLIGRVTDLLIGDLFEDKVDEVWPPMNEMKREPASLEA